MSVSQLLATPPAGSYNRACRRHRILIWTPSLCGRGGRQIGATSRCRVVETMIQGSRIGSPDVARPAAALVGLACDLSQAPLTPLPCLGWTKWEKGAGNSYQIECYTQGYSFGFLETALKDRLIPPHAPLSQSTKNPTKPFKIRQLIRNYREVTPGIPNLSTSLRKLFAETLESLKTTQLLKIKRETGAQHCMIARPCSESPISSPPQDVNANPPD